jgi:UDP-N-acetylglucosamine 2-epimerase (non-hydrolysing)
MPTPATAPIAVLFGTRPEAIKLAPVILELRRTGVPHLVVTTGQHEDLVEGILGLFEIQPDANLALMRPDQTLDYLLARSISLVGELLDQRRPAGVVVQGDTTSMLGSALAAFHHRVPVAHVEAGLRSGDMGHPFPEEMNRRAASVVARWHFAPTAGAAANLEREGVSEGIQVVGNTVVDALTHIVESGRARIPDELAGFVGGGPYLVATAHRRESWEGGIERIAHGLREVLAALPDHRLVFVAHPNPVARGPVDALLGSEPQALVVDAIDYPAFLGLLRGARLAVSDSGGVQEEGPTLGVPVLVTRQTTERPEGLDAGAVELVGTDAARIRDAALAVLGDAERRERMSRAATAVYGDGHAAARIVATLTADLDH